jgi:phosphatidylglycerol lysyltransferase
VLADAVPRLVGLGPDAAPVTGTPPRRGARWFRGSLPWLGAGVGMFVTISALAPTAHRRRREREIGQVAEIVAAHGDSSVAPFALGSDLDWYFSPTGRSVVAYRFESDVLLAAGDPIGPAEERALVTSGFLRHGAEHDWACAFYQARPEFLPEYVAGRMTAVHIGLDPVLDPAGFTLEGGAMGDVRRATRRLERDGIEFQSFRPADSPLHPEGADAALAAALRDISAEWLAGQAGGEKGFLMGRFDARELPGRWVVVARRAGGGRVEAFATWLAVPAATAWTLDLMRRRADAPAGVMDFLVARSVAAAAQHGDRRLSLGLCALAGQAPPGVEEAGAVENERLRGALRRRLAGFYDFAGVYHWKKKFQPRFEDRYLVVSSRLAIPRVALALLRAQSPHGLRGYLRRPGA